MIHLLESICEHTSRSLLTFEFILLLSGRFFPRPTVRYMHPMISLSRQEEATSDALLEAGMTAHICLNSD